MVISKNAVLIELDGTLFNSEEEDVFGLLKVYQKIDPEAKELIQDMQTYMNLIGFYNIDHRFHSILEKRLKNEGLNFAQLIVIDGDHYQQVKNDAYFAFSGKYAISCYIDEKEKSPWHTHPKISRLRMR